MNTTTQNNEKDEPVVLPVDLCDYFAAKAMQGILANPNKDYLVVHLAGEAYSIADAMLTEREKV